MDEYFELFESEALENTKRMSDALLALEKDPTNTELIEEVHRAAHTIKGAAATIGLNAISDLAHAMEDFMAGIKRIDSETIDLMFTALSAIERMIEEAKEQKSLEDAGPVIRRLRGEREEKEEKEGEKEREKKEEEKEKKEGEKEEEKIPEIRKANYVRINVSILDELMDILGQLIVAKNALKAKVGSEDIDQLERIVGGLQDGIFRARLVAISQIFEQFPRVVRELSREENKRIELLMEGGDTEMDRSMIDAISEPLVHLVRNAIDHGIETVDERKNTGKSESGKIWLRARREGDMVTIEVEDDGRGMDVDRIRQKGIEKGLIDESATEEEVLDLVFVQGFSTSERVTKVSGRGVGMDVVRKAVETFGGSVSLSTAKGKGTKVTLKLPFTIVVTRVFLISIGSSIYAVPVDYVTRILDLKPLRIYVVGQSRMLALEDRSVQFIDLKEILLHPSASSDSEKSIGLLIESSGRSVVLGVDQVVGIESVVTRPLEARFFSGTTVLGDGTPVLVIDPAFFLKSGRS